MKKILSHWLPVLLWAGVIFYFSSLPAIQSTKKDWLDFIFKKSAHVTEYAIFYLLLIRAINTTTKTKTAFLIGLFYAFIDEIHQLFTPGRGGSLRDTLVFDTTGLIVGWLIYKQIFIQKLKWTKKL